MNLKQLLIMSNFRRVSRHQIESSSQPLIRDGGTPADQNESSHHIEEMRNQIEPNTPPFIDWYLLLMQ